MKQFLSAFALGVWGLAAPVGATSFEALFPDLAATEDAEIAEMIAPLRGMDFQQGVVTLEGGIATMNVGESFYFLNAADSMTVLTDMWGNPPDPTVMGMIFPADATPVHSDAWGMTVSFEDIGYVKDEDAESYDYDALLAEMQADTLATNPERLEAGYDRIELVGWAEQPTYDKQSRKLYWAKELKFGESDIHTLNYDIRALGRKGVLVMSFIAGMEQLDDIRAAAPQVLALAEFTDGNRYADFQPGVDTVAAVGIGGLIAGKVLAKSGFLVLALALLKKGGVLLLLPLAWLGRLFTRKSA